jgi:hypothetical protein
MNARERSDRFRDRVRVQDTRPPVRDSQDAPDSRGLLRVFEGIGDALAGEMARVLAPVVVPTLLLVSMSFCTPGDPTFTVPAPFALQFVGSYAADGPSRADWLLQLHRDGSYDFFADSRSERGAFLASPTRELPLSFHGATWMATATAYDGQLHLISDEWTATLRALEPVGPIEALCDATGGRWTDDDPDGATGLYCVCPSPRVYLPSIGGCEL